MRAAEPPANREIDELRALGYLAFAEDVEETGVVTQNGERMQRGINLIATRVRCRAVLVDAGGHIAHTWHLPHCRGWDHTELLANGDLLAAAKARPRAEALSRVAKHDRFLVRLGWDSKVVWRRDLWAHHDAIALPDGRVVALTSEMRRIPRVHRRVPMRDDRITFLDGDSLSLYDLLANNDVGFKLQKVAVSQERGNAVVDLLHSNALEWLSGDNILVTMRHQDTIAMVDVHAKKLTWAWGQGELSGPHDATMLPNGNLLLFDNGLARQRSRVVEMEPASGKIVWQYGWGAGDLEFFTRSHGSAQRLENSNTLIAVSDHARVIEIARSGDLVWDYFVPKLADERRRGTINRVRRYPEAHIRALLER